MRFDGWVFMILSWGALLGTAVFCFSRVLRHRKK